jgi:hypothetical protein
MREDQHIDGNSIRSFADQTCEQLTTQLQFGLQRIADIDALLAVNEKMSLLSAETCEQLAELRYDWEILMAKRESQTMRALNFIAKLK